MPGEKSGLLEPDPGTEVRTGQSKSCSNTQRMVSTVGPASTGRPPALSCRILPPGVLLRSTTVTSKPAAAAEIALASPPAPAPTTITVCVCRIVSCPFPNRQTCVDKSINCVRIN
jgi:hypothetical protein